MFNSISWTNYVVSVAFLLIAYYAFVGIKFYSSELCLLLQGKRKLPRQLYPEDDLKDQERNIYFQQSEPDPSTSHERYAPSVEVTDDTIQQVEELTAKLRKAIAEAVSKNYLKEEFILSLQLLLKKYPFLKGSLFLGAINDLIASECKKYGYIHLSAEERVTLWNE